MGFALSDISILSASFDEHGSIPKKYTGEGEDVSPALAIGNTPQGTQSLAIFCHDPDAPLAKPGAYGFTHWVLYNLPADTSELEEGSNKGTAGVNNFDKSGYNGPMPPEGHGLHHYYFWVVALDADLNLPEGLTLEEFLQKAEPNIIAMNRLVGTYQRG